MTYKVEDFPEHPKMLEVVSNANAFLVLKKGYERFLENELQLLEMQKETSRKLFEDGCYSEPQHMLQFFNALIAEYKELKEELDYLL